MKMTMVGNSRVASGSSKTNIRANSKKIAYQQQHQPIVGEMVLNSTVNPTTPPTIKNNGKCATN